MRRLLQLNTLHLNGDERAGGAGGGGGRGEMAEANRVLRLMADFVANVGWWRWYVQQGNTKEGRRIAAPFYRSMKQTPEKGWFSDASYEAIGGFYVETGVYWRYQLMEESKRGWHGVRGGKATGYPLTPLELMRWW